MRKGSFKNKHWSTTVCDVANHQLIDVIPTREFPEVACWLYVKPHHIKSGLQYGCLDMSHSYNSVFQVVTPQATRVIDRFHVMRHAILALDEYRRRVQQVQLGHRSRSGEPIYKARKLLVIRATAADPELSRASRVCLHWGTPRVKLAWPTVSRRPSRPSMRLRTPNKRLICCGTSSNNAQRSHLRLNCADWPAR